jgi:hypothetical protein
MPTFTPKLLANGQLPNAKGTLYTCPAATQTLVKTINLVATNISRTINIYIKRVTSRRIIAKDTNLDITLELAIERNIILEAGDLIEGDASAAAEVDYLIFGTEIT